MNRISTVIIGAGQAGLAMSRCLSERSIAHVVIERGEVANAWIHDRWDGLRLLTPNWQSRLPGGGYAGADPDGFMTAPEVARLLGAYANANDAPVQDRTTVTSVTVQGFGYRVATDAGDWMCDNVVLATGACALARVPELATEVPQEITQLTSLSYKSPDQVPAGGVLVVGASASGMQIASELCAAGHEVTLAVGSHIRVPRRYRGRDIQWWMDQSGVSGQGIRDVDDIARARRVPSLQLVGDPTLPILDLNTVQAQGIEVVGRFAGLRHGVAQFSGALANHCALSDQKMHRLLKGFDAWADAAGLTDVPAADDLPATTVKASPRLTWDLTRGGIRTIIWATGYRPDFSWARLPVFDAKGALRHSEGVVGPGLYVLGLPFQRRRNSALIDGVGHDAIALADHLVRRQTPHAA